MYVAMWRPINAVIHSKENWIQTWAGGTLKLSLYSNSYFLDLPYMKQTCIRTAFDLKKEIKAGWEQKMLLSIKRSKILQLFDAT